MNAFTPGPWVARMQKNKYRRDLGWIIEFPNGRIAWASLAYADTNEEAKADDPAREANARLIAASPELYEALEAIVKSLVDEDDEGLIEHAEQIVNARAALSKVKG